MSTVDDLFADSDEDGAFDFLLNTASDRLEKTDGTSKETIDPLDHPLIEAEDAKEEEEPTLVVALDGARNLNLDLQRALEAIKRQDPGKTPSVEQRQLSKHVEQQISDLIGCTPICLRDPAVQQMLIAQNPELAGAFENKMLRGFVMGLDNAGLSLCIGFLFLSIVRNLLKECLRKQKLESDGRQQFNTLMINISEQMDSMLDRTDRFVGHMSDMVRRIGSASHLLSMGAPVHRLIETLTDVCEGIAEEAKECDDTTEEIKASVRAVGSFLNSRLQSDNAFDILQKKLSAAAENYDLCLAELNEKTAKRAAYRSDLICSITSSKGMKASAEIEAKQLQALLAKFDVRLADTQEKKDALEDQKYLAASERQDEIKEEKPAVVTKASVQEQIEFEKQQIQAEIERLKLQRVRAATKGQEYLSKAEVASDGKERVVEKRHSFFTFLLRQQAPDRLLSIQVHDNEKKRFQKLADRFFATASDLATQIENLRNELNGVEARVVESMRAAFKKAREERKKALEEGFNARVATLDCQIKNLNALLVSTRTRRASVAMRLQSKQADVGKLSAIMDRDTEKLRDYEDEKDTSFPQVESARERLGRTEVILRAAQDEVDTFVNQMDLADMDDFRIYAQTLEILVDTVQHVPLAIRQLNNSLTYTYKMFDSEMFTGNVEVFDTPEQKAAYLLRTTTEVHGLCEVAWQAANAPLKSLLTHNSSDLVKKLVTMQTQQFLEAPPTGVVITEVEDEDGPAGPSVAKEDQQEDKPRRRAE